MQDGLNLILCPLAVGLWGVYDVGDDVREVEGREIGDFCSLLTDFCTKDFIFGPSEAILDQKC